MDAHAIIGNFRRTVTTQYFDFNGRTTRSLFWYYVLVYALLYITVSIVESLLGFHALTPYSVNFYNPRPLTGLLSLALLLPSLGIGVRRLHDTNRSGFWLLVGLIPIVGWLVLIYFYVQPGTACANQYGADTTGSCPTPPPTV